MAAREVGQLSLVNRAAVRCLARPDYGASRSRTDSCGRGCGQALTRRNLVDRCVRVAPVTKSNGIPRGRRNYA